MNKRFFIFLLLAVLLLQLFFSACDASPPEAEQYELTVYVCQFAEKHYRYGLLEGAPNHGLEALMQMQNYDCDEMRAMLAEYDISPDRIAVVAWQNPLSSYIAPIHIYDTEGKTLQSMEDYISEQREMLGLS